MHRSIRGNEMQSYICTHVEDVRLSKPFEVVADALNTHQELY